MNPFSSRRIRPDNNIYRFDGDAATDDARREDFFGHLISMLQTDRCAAIVGPHGTGKSTLLRSIESDLRSRFDKVVWTRLTSDKRYSHRDLLSGVDEISLAARRKPSGVGNVAEAPEGLRPAAKIFELRSTCLVVDGYEQLRWWHRLALVRGVKQRTSTALLVTCHQRSRLMPTCIETQWNESISRFLTDQKLDGLPAATRGKLWANFENRLKDANPDKRNLRELWFSMYDEFEIIRHQESQQS